MTANLPPNINLPLNDLDERAEQAALSSEKNRNFFISHLLVALYVLVVTLGTSDLQLLVPSQGVKLPIVDLNVPLQTFYIGVPFLLLALHFNLLHNIESHHRKLIAWKNAQADSEVADYLIFPFIFDFDVLGKSGQLQSLTRFFSQVMIFWFTPFCLLVIFMRFSDYQSLPISIWHYSSFLVDFWLVERARRGMNEASTEASNSNTPFFDVYVIIWQFILATFRQIFGLSSFILKGYRLVNIFASLLALTALVQVIIFITLISTSVPPKILGNFLVFSPIIEIERRENLLQLDENSLRFQAEMSGNKREDLYNWFIQSGNGLDLRKRSLKLAQLSGADLRRASMENAQLQGADLSFAQLQGANLWEAQLQGANLWQAQLQGADLSFAKLQGANLSSAKLQGANLWKAQLQGAYLRGAQLRGANLSLAQLQGANLSLAQLQGVDLILAELQGANLSLAQLQGANLSLAQLQGADLNSAQLQGTYLGYAQLQGADLSRAQLQGAIIYKTEIRGVESFPIEQALFLSEESDGFSTEIVPSKERWDSCAKVFDDKIIIAHLRAIQERVTNDTAIAPKVQSASPKRINQELRTAICKIEKIENRDSAWRGIKNNYGHAKHLLSEQMKSRYLAVFKLLQDPLICG